MRPAGAGDGSTVLSRKAEASEAQAEGGVRHREEPWQAGRSAKKENGSAQEHSANFHLFQNFQLPQI
jgi:hypothetical protein